MFHFFLAEKLGMPVGVLLRSIDALELVQWQLFYKKQQEAMDKAKSKPTDDSKILDASVGSAIAGASASVKARKKRKSERTR